MRRIRSWLFLVVALALIVYAWNRISALQEAAPDSVLLREAPKAPASTAKVKVKRVVDGDTFVIAGGARVRLLGINAPETVDPRRPVERFGKEASAFAQKLLEGKTVLLEPGRNPKDKYGRLLAWVWLTDGRFVNGELVRLGYAQVSTYRDNPDHAEYLVRAQREAREANRGLWGK
jgi:micrococcal nuclease